jgi:hypothetical protein
MVDSRLYHEHVSCVVRGLEPWVSGRGQGREVLAWSDQTLNQPWLASGSSCGTLTST